MAQTQVPERRTNNKNSAYNTIKLITQKALRVNANASSV